MSSDCFSAKSVVQVKNLKKKCEEKIAELEEWDALPQRANKNIFFFFLTHATDFAEKERLLLANEIHYKFNWKRCSL